jgi:lipopolysaccharide/colanic/teichoic acid biosynthesis glycosyltransferase
MIGPRPDSFSHARQFLRTIPEYRQRHSVRPGISGLAQVSLGYAVGTEATRAKALMDQKYIRTAGFKTDTKLVFQTIQTVLARAGA